MSKWANDTALDAYLNYIADNGAQLDVVSDTSTPTDLTNSLASTSLTTGTGGADYSISDGDTNGRKLTVAQQADISIGTSGEANHIVISDGAGTLLLVTTCTTQSLTSGSTVTVPSFDDEIADPS